MLVIDWNIGWFTCGLGSELGDFIVAVALLYKVKMNYSGFSVDTIIILDTTTLSYVQITDSNEYLLIVSVPN